VADFDEWLTEPVAAPVSATVPALPDVAAVAP